LPSLVDTAAHAASAAAPDTERRFGGLARLYGALGAQRIAAAHVAVVGVGGVGSWAVEALARSGVAALTLIDLDHVSESNINRQIQALGSTLGQAKVLALKERMADIHPACRVQAVEDFVEPGNWPALLPAGVDAVIDACDQTPAKLAMARWALRTGAVFITVGAAGGKRLAHRVDIDDLAQASHDPLLANLRRRLRREQGVAPKGDLGLACVFSREPVALPEAACAADDANDGSLNCHGYGSVVSVTATFGHCAAGWVLDQLARQPPKAGAAAASTARASATCP